MIVEVNTPSPAEQLARWLFEVYVTHPPPFDLSWHEITITGERWLALAQALLDRPPACLTRSWEVHDDDGDSD
jgi:hypothetical protein